VPVLLGAALLEDTQDESVSFLLDITERKRAEKERDQLLVQERQARSEAEKALGIRDEFVMIAAHELRTPLTPLKIQLHLLKTILAQETLIGASEIRKKNLLKLFETSDRHLDRLAKLVEDLLDLSKMSAGQLPLNLEAIDLSELVRDVVERYQPEWMQANCTIELHIERKISGQWDRLRIEQVVVNLLTNAIKYGAGKPINIAVTQERNFAKLTVRDYGIGIEEKDQKRIFGRFERAISVRHFGGFGLGLYISQQIVQAHGGSIYVESHLGAGSTFTVSLPLTPLFT
ncbi:MAG: HAMP domain-containing sensor histidine kinase, partial [Bdellovibrionia bacterium]